MGFGGGSKPPAIPVAPPAASPPTLANAQVQAAGDNAHNQAVKAAAANADNPTGGQGITTAPDTAKAKLLGQ